jgi:hypothetical protein
MTVKELIEELQQIENQDIEIVIRGTGPDSWVYMNDIEYTEQVYCVMIEGEGLIEVDEDEDDDDIIKVFVIDGGMF